MTPKRIVWAEGLSDADVREMGEKLLPEIARRRALYAGGRPLPQLAGKTVVLVDDGIATGATVKASLQALRTSGAARIVLAVPVAPPDVWAQLCAMADDCVCLQTPASFGAVGAHYRHFPQVSDEEVVTILRDHGGGHDDA